MTALLWAVAGYCFAVAALGLAYVAAWCVQEWHRRHEFTELRHFEMWQRELERTNG